jgi:hypothetical protein
MDDLQKIAENSLPFAELLGIKVTEASRDRVIAENDRA